MWTEAKLNELLTTPSQALIDDIKKIKGDITVLGAGGKMGPTLCVLAKNAVKKAGIDKKIIAVSRYSDAEVKKYLEPRKKHFDETVFKDLSDILNVNYQNEIKEILLKDSSRCRLVTSWIGSKKMVCVDNIRCCFSNSRFVYHYKSKTSLLFNQNDFKINTNVTTRNYWLVLNSSRCNMLLYWLVKN